MRRLPILLVFALMFALLALAPATADKPNCDPDSDDNTNPPHASCKTDDTPPTTTTTPGPLGVGLSCEDYAELKLGSVEPMAWDTGAGESQFPTDEPLLVTSGEVLPCIDFWSTVAGRITVTVTSVEPEAKRNSVLAAVVKDSHPGDHCGAVVGDPEHSALNLNLRNENESSDTISSGTIQGIEAATLNACGTRFAEAELDGNEVVNATTDQTDKPNPLAITFLMTGKPGITANITLHFKPGGSQ
jgi:hypothetical protein